MRFHHFFSLTLFIIVSACATSTNEPVVDNDPKTEESELGMVAQILLFWGRC